MTISDWTLIGTSFGGIFAALYAAVMHFRVSRKEDRDAYASHLEKTTDELIHAKDAVIDTLKMDVTAWKARFEAEHDEYIDYRTKAHDQLNRANTLMMQIQSENVELKARTDITPILKFQSEQSQINEKVLFGLNLIVNKLNIGVKDERPK